MAIGIAIRSKIFYKYLLRQMVVVALWEFLWRETDQSGNRQTDFEVRPTILNCFSCGTVDLRFSVLRIKRTKRIEHQVIPVP